MELFFGKVKTDTKDDNVEEKTLSLNFNRKPDFNREP